MRLGIVILADLDFGVGARRVEIAKRRMGEAMRLVVPTEHPLDHQLALAVGIDRLMRRALGDRHAVRSSVDRRCRGEHDVAQAGRPHGLEEL